MIIWNNNNNISLSWNLFPKICKIFLGHKVTHTSHTHFTHVWGRYWFIPEISWPRLYLVAKSDVGCGCVSSCRHECGWWDAGTRATMPSVHSTSVRRRTWGCEDLCLTRRCGHQLLVTHIIEQHPKWFKVNTYQWRIVRLTTNHLINASVYYE